MKFIILAAGSGSRLAPLTNEVPKCLTKVHGTQLLEYQLMAIEDLAITKKILVKGYLAEKWHKEGFEEYINDEYNHTNMVWTLFKAENEFDDDLIISYGDIAYSKNVFKKIYHSRFDISVLIDTDWKSYWAERYTNPLDDLETLIINDDDTITDIGNKPTSYDQIHGQYIGLVKFSKKGVEWVQKIFHGSEKINGKKLRNAYMTDMLQELIKRGYPVRPIRHHGEWVEIDTVKDLNAAITQDRLRSMISGGFNPLSDDS